jgi:hypothetical protein
MTDTGLTDEEYDALDEELSRTIPGLGRPEATGSSSRNCVNEDWPNSPRTIF